MKQITLETKEFYDLMKSFERFKLVRGRYDKENRDMWRSGAYYQDGEVNQAFKIFLSGCNYGIALSY